MRRRSLFPANRWSLKSISSIGREWAVQIFLVFYLLLSVLSFPAFSALPELSPSEPTSQNIETAPVILDHRTLFPVRGISAYPAKQRALLIAERIRAVASDSSIPVDAVTSVETNGMINLVAGDFFIMSIVDADAAMEGVAKQQLAIVYIEKIRQAVESYRQARSQKNITRGIVYACVYTIALIVIIFLVVRLFRKLHSKLERSIKEKLRSLEMKSARVIGVGEAWSAIEDGLKMVRFVVVLVLFYLYLETVLRLFPWSRFYALKLFDYVMNPLNIIGVGILKEIPDILFIIILVIIVRLGLKFMHIFFRQIELGSRSFAGFYPEWAKPTDKLLTFCIVAFAAVVAFPYVPGSSSAAFKGISIFIGVLFSLGSQSAVSNTIAGFIVHFRRAFKIGDRIQVNDVMGDVTAIRMQVTHILTVKNVEVIVPNSAILAGNVYNYSSRAREKGLILHTEVSIGYDAPWRQVHEILLMAAKRTKGLLEEPPPFILQKGLDDFYVRYELNVYTDTPHMMATIYSELHKNIQDCFNEYNVQIMSPHYRGDPAQAKIVRKEDWYSPPAHRDD
jgi:small-conductance mechanosensitive channel